MKKIDIHKTEHLLVDHGEDILEILRYAVRQAVLEHKRAENPIAAWHDGKVVLIQPDDILVEDPATDQDQSALSGMDNTRWEKPIPENLTGPVNQLMEKRVMLPPAPWRKIGDFAIGGLREVGYAPDSDLVLVISSQGRGAFDCLTGEKLARDSDISHTTVDEQRLTALGIGPLDGRWIRVCGLSGGGLPNATDDNWYLEALPLPWPDHHVFLSSQLGIFDCVDDATKVMTNGLCELRAYGFSETGRSFIVALSCTLSIFARER